MFSGLREHEMRNTPCIIVLEQHCYVASCSGMGERGGRMARTIGSLSLIHIYIFYQRESLISGMGMLLKKISELVQRYYGQGFGSFITDDRSTDLNLSLIHI